MKLKYPMKLKGDLVPKGTQVDVLSKEDTRLKGKLMNDQSYITAVQFSHLDHLTFMHVSQLDE